MTICELRNKFPSKDFLFFKNGFEFQGVPFLHQKIKDFEIKSDCVFIEL